MIWILLGIFIYFGIGLGLWKVVVENDPSIDDVGFWAISILTLLWPVVLVARITSLVLKSVAKKSKRNP